MRAIFDQFDRNIDFPHDRLGHVVEEGNRTVVRMYDPKQHKCEFETEEFAAWDRVPGLKRVAIQAYLHAAARETVRSHVTRLHMAMRFSYMVEFLLSAGMADRTPETLTFYDCEEVIDIVASTDLANKVEALTPLRLIVDRIWSDPAYVRRDPHLFVRNAPFAGKIQRRGVREIMPDPVFADFYARAAADAASIAAEVDAFRNSLATSTGRKAPLVAECSTPAVCARWVYREFGPKLPMFTTLRASAKYKAYANAILRCGGWKRVARLIHPGVYDLMPFLGLLGCQTLFNKAVLTELSLGDVDRTELLGQRRIVLTPLKKRAGRQQFRSFELGDAPDNPHVVLEFLERWTTDLRGMVPEVFRNRIFLFWSLVERKEFSPGATGFYGLHTGSGAEDARFPHAWRTWLNDSKLPEVQFSSIRVTGLNLAHRAFAGDVRAIAALASHSSPEVFDSSYKSAHSCMRNDRRMAKAMALRDRLLRSDGKIDPTKRLRGEGVQAATPGFGCLDPMSSPISGQVEGRPCAAYGQCPDCPLATTDTSAPANLVRMKQMEAEYVQARDYLAPHYWRDKYSQHLDTLRTAWLPAFTDPDVALIAARMRAQPLPPLG